MRDVISRRRFLQVSGSAALGLSLGRCGESEEAPPLLYPTADGLWGAPDPGQQLGMLPLHRQPQRVLEVFLLGGLCPWDTFYVVPEFGDPARGGPFAGHQWWTFQGDGDLSPQSMFARCGGGSRPLLQPFGLDSEGVQVQLGPWVYPLRDRPDILARMRIWVLHHTLEPHEGAIPLGMTGHGRGVARMAGLGAHVQRYHQDRWTQGARAPFAYTIFQSSMDIDSNGDAATAIGLHRASARPMAIRLGPEAPLYEQLLRRAAGGKQGPLDALIGHYTQRLRGRLIAPGRTTEARSSAVSDYAFAREVMQNHGQLASMFTPDALAVGEAAMCERASQADETQASLRLAVSLLTHPQQPARYVNVVEGGLYTDEAGQGYDTHQHHILQGSPNVVYALRRMAEQINEPGEGDPSKLDLDRDMVLINTEFGRTPVREITEDRPDGTGLDHWPFAYVVVGFGGPIDADRAGVVGAIGENSQPISWHSPTEHRAAMLLSMGIWPFSPEAFAVGDVRDAKDEIEAAARLKEGILGYGS